MKKLLIFVAILFMASIISGNAQKSTPDNVLSKKEIKKGWKLLFDGKTPSGWINSRTKSFPANGWDIKDGMLIINPATKNQGGGGDIVTVDKFRNFELSVDFRYAKGANSGIKYFIDIESDNGKRASIGCEYQVLDDRIHPDAKAGVGGNRTLAGLYDLIAPLEKKDNGEDEWNNAKIVVNGTKVQHWLNGKLTVEYERGNAVWKELVAKSKFKEIHGFAEVEEGRILLQEHGNVVSFKNVKIRVIE